MNENNYLILTEEKPSIWEINVLLHNIGIKKNPKDIIIKHNENNFSLYNIKDISNVKIYLVEGTGSFIDYLVYKIKSYDNLNEIVSNLHKKPPYIVLESTKTRPHDSGNSGPYQRINKFITLMKIYNIKEYEKIIKILFYDNDLSQKNRSFTRGIKICKSLNINIVNKYNKLPEYYLNIKKFETIKDLTKEFNGKLYKEGNNRVRLLIRENNNNIEIQAKLMKPKTSYVYKKDKDNKKIKNQPKVKKISYRLDNDPNIGFTVSISAFIRFFSDKRNKKIIFINHGLKQSSINNSSHKWFHNMNFIGNYELQNLKLSKKNLLKEKIKKKYFKIVSDTKEKKASILLDCLLREIENDRYWVIFSNHAGTEKTDIKTIDGEYSIPTIKRKEHLYPDLVFIDKKNMILYIIEGKIWKTRNKGLKELEKMDKFINRLIKFHDRKYLKKITKTIRCLCLMAPNISFKKVNSFSEKSKYPTIFSINKDKNLNIFFN